MGQKLFTDKIGTLSHITGNIQMAASSASPAYLTIGGQQYKVTTTLSIALPAMSANTRYQVFAVLSGGSPALVISQNENSVGPSGATSWKLLGSLYSNGMSPVTFGSFVSAEGVPQSEWIRFLSTKTNFTTSAEYCFWRLIGDSVEYKYMYVLNAAPTGTIYISTPSGQVPDGTKFDLTANDGHVGQVTLNDGSASANYHGHIQPSNLSGTFRIVNSSGQNEWNASIPASLGNADRFSGVINLIPIVGFSNIPIKDR